MPAGFCWKEPGHPVRGGAGFWVAELDGEVVGCGALHVLWSDLGEVRTVAVDPKVKGHGISHTVVDRLLEVARELQLERLFVLTFETEFFGRHGFTEIEGTPVTAGCTRRCAGPMTSVSRVPGPELRQTQHPGQYRMLLVL